MLPRGGAMYAVAPPSHLPSSFCIQLVWYMRVTKLNVPSLLSRCADTNFLSATSA